MTSERFPGLDAGVIRRLLWHEAQVHGVPDRQLRDLGDAIMLTDPHDAEPFWNRLAAIDWPADPDAFAQRLAEIRVLFAAAGRQPHIWLLPPWDAPADIKPRLEAEGFVDTGLGMLMAARPGAAGIAAETALLRASASDVRLERLAGLAPAAAAIAAEEVVAVLVEAFGVEEARHPGVLAETRASLSDARFTHYLIRVGGAPAAVCRRATFDGVSYLSSIGTTYAARGRGLGRLVTARATLDAVLAGSDWIHLGVFVDNDPAIALYRSLGFDFAGDPGPDMLYLG